MRVRFYFFSSSFFFSCTVMEILTVKGRIESSDEGSGRALVDVLPVGCCLLDGCCDVVVLFSAELSPHA